MFYSSVYTSFIELYKDYGPTPMSYDKTIQLALVILSKFDNLQGLILKIDYKNHQNNNKGQAKKSCKFLCI